MRVELRLFASLGKYASHPMISTEGIMDLPSLITVGDLVDRLGIPRQEIKLIFLNGVHAHLDSKVNENDRLGLFPPIGGG
ncbi:MAG: MoaD/ThiS family protein [Proteobacteria bacterium]|nr:MoaD/ThiS family protein [Pseudomonadota bacterium]